ncbi:biotin-dependent carboxyltransferase family protein [Luteimicrobium subarcticum]|uniref:Biotin-dependent carboxylase-like uncharacterized protein n=1 Tax=Luteimicrobium subarcticum TaxID=620910 RepID=A0A2M8W199_9MICO|nr:biotin-dependent carboxyltransferase family protein [Luteimicrobium subarcticum]PJI84703.1 biotin-dependent carboxylase-like uncharacterized protein [Luteimicrobium subarcticum]
MIEVLAPGPLALVEDLGRTGAAAWGVPRSGAADRGALRLANRVLANPDGAAAIEVTLGGLRVRFLDDHVLVLTGAPAAAHLGGVPVGTWAVLLARAGEELVLGLPTTGLRTYVGVRGGIAVPPVLGSRSTDLLSGLGPDPLRTGDLLPVGVPSPDGPVVAQVPTPGRARSASASVRLARGVRDEWFAQDVAAVLRSAPYVVGQDSNRTAVRLTGRPVPRRRHDEYPSEGVVRGAVQVPPDGMPIVFLADHPVTGGYPVLGVVGEDDVDRLAQARPGDEVFLELE